MHKLEASAGKGNKNAKLLVTEEAIAEALGSPSFRKYLTPPAFKAAFGPALDKVDKLDAAAGKYVRELTVDDLLTHKKLNKVWAAHAKAAHTKENYDFLTKGHTLAPQKIWENFVHSDAPQQLNLNAPQLRAWEDLAERVKTKTGKWSEAGDLIKSAYRSILGLVSSDELPRLRAQRRAEILAAVGGDKMLPLIAQARKIAGLYGQEIMAYQTRWERHDASFCKPLVKELNAILTHLDQLEATYTLK